MRMQSPVVSPAILAAWMDAGLPDLRIVDMRWYLGQPHGTGRAAYESGHVPGAIHIDLDIDLVAPSGPGRHPLPDPVTLASSLGARGIGDDNLVVAYDDVGGWVAARLWWMLDDLGFGAAGRGGVVVLDGGLAAWLDEGRGLSTEVPTVEPTVLHLAPRWHRVMDRADLKNHLGDVLLLDARGAPRYRGEIEPIDPKPGHIPTAVNAPVDGNLGPDGRFLSGSELAQRFTRLRTEASGAGMAKLADPGVPVVTSCGSGVSACQNALAMRIAGLPDAILYPGSYSDWSTAGEAVVIGPEPGPPPA